MIPKVINYCWFGKNPLSKKAKKCIASWKKYCPDYEIKQWNESNFDINCCEYVKEAYKSKKWAFVSDYARFKILYENGGVYLDTDVQLIKNIDDVLLNGPYMGYEAYVDDERLNPNHEWLVNSGLGMAAEKGMALYREVLRSYEKDHFINVDGNINYLTVVERVTQLLKKHGLTCKGKKELVMGITVYPEDYFCPYSFTTGAMHKTKNTYSIHLYSASWQGRTSQIKNKIKRCIPTNIKNFLLGLKHHE